MTDYDHPYKRLFSHPIMMADLILGYLDPKLVEVCDISSLKRCNGSYVTDDLREREDDLIWKLKWGDHEMVLYLLIEFQSGPDPIDAYEDDVIYGAPLAGSCQDRSCIAGFPPRDYSPGFV